MAVRKTAILQPGFWFLTFTCSNWISLFEITNGYDIVYKWFKQLRQAGHKVTGYVIMPNHVHLLLAYKGGSQSLNTLVSNGKRFMAYELVERLKQLERNDILKILADKRTKAEITANKKHKVFETSFDALLCTSIKFIHQKLNYIHNNPCVKKWTLAAYPAAYKHSSAAFYDDGNVGNYSEITNFIDLNEGVWMHLLQE